MNESTLLSISVHLAASKRPSFHNSVRHYFRTLINFLQSHGLTTHELIPNGEPIPDNFKLMQSDLTEKGFTFFRGGVTKWSASVEEGTPVDDISILENELRTLEEATT